MRQKIATCDTGMTHSKNTDEKLSIIIPNFNHSHLLKETVRTHINQTYRPIEIIIVDDLSTDDSVSIIKSIAAEHPEVRLLQRNARGGPNAAINTGLSEAKGDFVCFCGADDFVETKFAEHSITLLKLYPDAAFCFLHSAARDVQTNIVVDIPLALSDRPTYFSPDDFAQLFARNTFSISSNTVVYRRPAIASIGGFPVDLEWQADWFSILALGFRHGACYCPETLACFTVNPKSYGNAGVKFSRGQKRLLFVFLKKLDESFQDISPRFRAAAVSPERRLRTLIWLATDRRGRRYISWRLVRRLIASEAWTWLRPITPISTRRFMRRLAGQFTLRQKQHLEN